MSRLVDRTGRRYGSWTVVRRCTERTSPSRVTFWVVRCDCGYLASRAASNLDSGSTTRCRSCAAKDPEVTRRKVDGRRAKWEQ